MTIKGRLDLKDKTFGKFGGCNSVLFYLVGKVRAIIVDCWAHCEFFYALEPDNSSGTRKTVFKAILASECYHCIACFFLLFLLAELIG